VGWWHRYAGCSLGGGDSLWMRPRTLRCRAHRRGGNGRFRHGFGHWHDRGRDERGADRVVAAPAPRHQLRRRVSGQWLGRVRRCARHWLGGPGTQRTGIVANRSRCAALSGAGRSSDGRLGPDAGTGPDRQPPPCPCRRKVRRAAVSAAHRCRTGAKRSANPLAGERRPFASPAWPCAGTADFRYHFASPAIRPRRPKLATGVGP
jgi:hypothetical protein